MTRNRSRSISGHVVIRDRELNQHFTNPRLAKWVVATTRKFFPKRAFFVEPSAGDGDIYKYLPDPKVGVELDKKLAKKNGYVASNFLEWKPKTSRSVVTIGNPPFNEAKVVGNYRPGNLAIKFINHAAEFSDVIAFILGRNFLKPSIQNKVNKNFHLRYQKILPKSEFGTVGTVFQVWVRSSKPRKLYKFKQTTDFEVVRYADKRANIAVVVWGNIGRVTTDKKKIKAIQDKAERKGWGNTRSHLSSFLLYAKDPKKVERVLCNQKARAQIKKKELTSSGNNPTINILELQDIYVRALSE